MPIPYAITHTYGENGNGATVQLRFNWLTDAPAQTHIRYETQAAVEANGGTFSAHSPRAEAAYTRVENNTPLVNDEIRAHINLAPLHSHKATLTLAAGQSYYYSVGNAGNYSLPALIHTREEKPGAFSFLWITDPQQDKYARGTPYVPWDGKISTVGSGNFQENLEIAIAHAFAPAQAALYANGRPAFALCTGDHCEHIYDKDGMDGFFQAAQTLLAATPYFPALGNHDVMGAPGHTGTWDSPDPYATLYKARFNPPRNNTPHPVLDGTNYFFTYGNALFMALQGNPWHTADFALDRQIDWMRQTISTHGKNRWKIIFLHHGIYTVSYDSIHGYEQLSAFYDEAGIDLVLSGHNHVYARSKPIRNFQPAPRGKGTVHITGGTVSGNCAWGGYIYKPHRTIPNENGLPMTQAMDFLSLTDQVDEMNKNIYQIITIDENGINITALRAHDNTIVQHNAPQPGDVAAEYKTPLTGTQPQS